MAQGRAGRTFALTLLLAAGTATSAARADEPPAPPDCGKGCDAQSTGENWATSRARVLTEQGQAHRRQGNVDLAIKRFNEALGIDATYGPAYIALASLREASGEADEAERVLEMGLDRIPGFAEGLTARAELFARNHRLDEAVASFLAVLALKPDDVTTLRRLVAVAPLGGLFPVALAAARRLSAIARVQGDTALASEMIREARALVRLVAEADPVRGGAGSREGARRALARLSR